MAGIVRNTSVVRRATDSPLSGAYIAYTVGWDSIVTNVTVHKTIKLPAGMKMKITQVGVRARAIASDPTVSVGSAATVTKYTAAVNITTNLGDLTLVSANQETAAGEAIKVNIVTDSGDTATDLLVTIHGFVTLPPTAAPGL